MSTAKSSSSDDGDDGRFDGLYLNVAQTTRGIEPLLDSVFSFLRRKTDFFSGPPGSGEKGTQLAIEKVHEVVRKHADLHLESQKKTQQQKTAAASKPKTRENKVDNQKVIEMAKDGAFDISQTPAKNIATNKKEEPDQAPTTSSVTEAVTKKTETSDEEAAEKPRGGPPEGNGGTVEGKYVWTQTLSEICLSIPVPDNTRGRDLNVSITKKHLKIGLRSPAGSWIVNAPLTKPVIVDDSFWTVEDGNRLVVNLQKINQMEWWEGVCEDDPKIDVRAIQPETSSLGDLDGDMRTTVEKMMYDQRQKAMGRPTSDEEEKLARLEEFKKKHPELDFTNAKIN